MTGTNLPCLWCMHAIKVDGEYICSKYDPGDVIEDILEIDTRCASLVPFSLPGGSSDDGRKM